MGFTKGKKYDITTIIDNNSIVVKTGTLSCPYAHLESFLNNWRLEETYMALEKEVAKEPYGLSVTYDGIVGNCPFCRTLVRASDPKPNICVCGQKLQWIAKIGF